MESFSSFDGCTIAYRDTGTGPLVLLLHGALVESSLNWELPGIIDQLVGSGFRVVAADARGHGASDTPHDPVAYAHGTLVRDAAALIDHLRADTAAVVGYSMGADTAIRLAAADDRVVSLVAGGIGASERVDYDPAEVAAAIRDDLPRQARSPLSESLAELARSAGGDPLAYAALFEGEVISPPEPVRYEAVTIPTLIINGADDEMVTSGPEKLAERFPSAVAVSLPGQDHLAAVFDPAFTHHVTAFLHEHHKR